MAADGSIIIDTSIDTDGMQVGTKEVENSLQRMAKTISGVGMTAKLSVKKQIDAFSRLNNQYAQQEQKVDSLKRKLIELSEQKIETSEYKKLEEELKLLEDKFDSVEAKQMEWINMGFPIDSAGIRELDEELDKIWADMDRINKKQEQMRKSGSAYMNPTDLKDYNVTQSKLLAEEQKLENMNSRLNTSYAGIKNNIQKYQKSLFKTDSATKKVTNSTSKLGKSVRNTQLSMGRMLATSVLFSTVFRIISAVTSGIGEGVNNLAQHSGTVNNSLSAMISSLERLKNAFATAFAPIINVVSPIISAFIDMLARAVTYVGMFFAALTGQSSFTKAVAVQKDYAAALQDTAGSAQDAADAMKDAEKAKNSYLSGLDEVNRYQSDKGSGSAGASGPSVGGGGLSPSDMFETVPIENNIKNLADKLKKIFGEIFKPFKEAWEKEGEATIKAANYAFSSLGNLAKSVGKSMMSVWTNGTGTKMLSTMLQIGQNVLKTVGNIAMQLEIAWNKNEVGTAIIQAIADAFQKVLDFVKRITKSTSEWAAELDFYPLLVSIKNLIESLSPIIEAIGDFLADLYENIVLPFLKWLIETALPLIINAVSAIFSFLEEHKWIIDAIGVSLIGAFAAEKIVPLIMSIIAGVMNFVSVIKGLIALLTGSGGLIGGIKAIGTVLGTGGIWGIAIGAAIAVGVLLIKNWDKIKAAATRLKEWVVEKTRKLKEDVVNAFMGLKEKASNILNIFAEFINTTWDKIKNTTTTIVNAVKDGAINGFNLLKQKVSGIMDSVKTKISSVWTGIKKTFSDVISWIKNTFTDAWSRAWNRVKSIFSNVFNGLSKLVKKPINAVIGIVNGAISAINGAISGIESAVSFGPWEIPTPWGTRTIGFSASFPRVPSVPYLASGAVIPPRSEFLAVLGDQKSGNNIEAPESLLRKIVREESGTSPGGGQYRFTAQLNRRTIFDEVIEEAKLRRDLNGQNPFLLT